MKKSLFWNFRFEILFVFLFISVFAFLSSRDGNSKTVDATSEYAENKMTAEEVSFALYASFYQRELQNGDPVVFKNGFKIEAGDGEGQTLRPTLNQLQAVGFAPLYANGAMYKIERVPANCKGSDCELNAYALSHGKMKLVFTTKNEEKATIDTKEIAPQLFTQKVSEN